MNQSESDKLVARAIARNTNIDPETRLNLARKFDPNLKSLNDGLYDEFKKYEESVVRPNGRVPAPKKKLEFVSDGNGGMEAVFTENGQYVRSVKLGKDGAK
jgi:hypothetical protein